MLPETLSDLSTLPQPPSSIGEITELEDGSVRRKATVDFYTYVHCKPNMTPFYVGKGQLSRAKGCSHRNQWYLNTVAKYGKENIVVEMIACKSEAEAFLREKLVISALRMSGVVLCNLTDGGEGASGVPLVGYRKQRVLEGHTAWRADPEKQKIQSLKLKGKAISAEQKMKLSELQSARMANPEVRAALSAKIKGFKHSDETKAKIRAAAVANAADPVILEKIRNGSIGHVVSSETRAKMSAAHIGKTLSLEHRAKISATKRGLNDA